MKTLLKSSLIVLLALAFAKAQPAPYVNWGGVNTVTGWWDMSTAGLTNPDRTGTGSPVGRDNCLKIGESYVDTSTLIPWRCTVTGTPGSWVAGIWQDSNLQYNKTTGWFSVAVTPPNTTESGFAARAVIVDGVRTVTGTSYTFTDADNGTVMRFTNGSAITATLNLAQATEPGFGVEIIQEGAGKVSIAAGGITALVQRQGFTGTAGAGAVMRIRCDGTRVCYMSGDMN